MPIHDLIEPQAAAPRRRLAARLGEAGAAMVEFGFVAPIFIAMVCAIMEFSGIMFVQAILEGSAREASRYGLTGFASGGVSREDQILAIVEDHTYGIVDMDELEMETLVYENFADVGQPEPFTDENGNELWDNDEPYTDINGNGTWDEDMGAAGLGGPGDGGGLPHELRLEHHDPGVRADLRRHDQPSGQRRRAQRALRLNHTNGGMVMRAGSQAQSRRAAGKAAGPAARRSWATFGRSVAGNVTVEFALSVPTLLLLMLGSAEMGRYIILHQKVDRVATTISDLVARAETISESQLDDIFTAAGQVAQPFDLANLGVVIVSSVTNADGTGPVIAWQRSGGGSYSASSHLGAEGDTPDLPPAFEVREGETAIISEVYYDFTPFLSELIVEPQIIYRNAHHRPRLGTLEDIEAG